MFARIVKVSKTVSLFLVLSSLVTLVLIFIFPAKHNKALSVNNAASELANFIENSDSKVTEQVSKACESCIRQCANLCVAVDFVIIYCVEKDLTNEACYSMFDPLLKTFSPLDDVEAAFEFCKFESYNNVIIGCDENENKEMRI